jgi:DNA processing protein
MAMKLEELKAWIGLQLVPGIGNATIRKLVKHFGSATAVWEAKRTDFTEIARFPARIVEELMKGPNEKIVEHNLNILKKVRAWAMTFLSKDYPSLLNEIPNPPSLLYGIGNPSVLKEKTIAVIGSRHPSSYGLNAARMLSSELAHHGFTIVSGLALGIDTACHQAALNSNGNTIAVKGCGIDVAYPRQNKDLVYQIANHGVAISELPPGSPPESKNFPIRNRIISGLSYGVVIVEANMKSGSLITASYALEQGREVMAVPGSIFSYKSKGTHWLIKQGARLVENCGDIMEALGLEEQAYSEKSVSRDMKGPSELCPEEQSIFDKLEPYPQHIDNIANLCGLTVDKVSRLLLQMELKDLVQSFPGQMYQLK